MNAQLQAANRIIAENNRTIAKMNQQLTTQNGNGNHPIALSAGEVMENVIIKGDLSKLSPAERSQYYMRVCESVGLNPLTTPFEYIALNGKLVLYALRACTDQLRSIHKVSVVSLDESERDGVFIVTAKMQNGEGRTDMAKGAVTIQGLKGDNLANAIMKCETKAKRRATLSLCGLGFLDETEIETIPDAARNTLPKKDSRDIYSRMQADIDGMQSIDALKAWMGDSKDRIAVLPTDWQDILRLRCQERLVDLRQKYIPKPQVIVGEMPDPVNEFGAWMDWLDTKCGLIQHKNALETFWNTTVDPIADKLLPPDQMQAVEIFNRHEARFAGE